MKKKILTILIFNFALLAVFLEITGQLFKRYDFLKDYKSKNKEELILIKNKNYINYVNHFRDFNYRSKGYASALLNHLTKICNINDVDRIYWKTKSDNYIAQSLYDKFAIKTDFLEYEIILKN